MDLAIHTVWQADELSAFVVLHDSVHPDNTVRCTGKFTENNLPSGARGGLITADKVRQTAKLIGLMKEIGQANGGKTCTQVAVNWTLCKGTFPIPGAKNAAQAKELAGRPACHPVQTYACAAT